VYLCVINENEINEEQKKMAVRGTYVLDDTAVSTTADNIT
jgi:hypothetical protein